VLDRLKIEDWGLKIAELNVQKSLIVNRKSKILPAEIIPIEPRTGNAV